MFCPKCGTQVPDTAAACSNCGTVFAAPGGAAAAEKVKAASRDAVQAFKTFATNPVGGLSQAFETLGGPRAFGVGLLFGGVFALCVVLGVYRSLPGFAEAAGVGGFFRIVVVAVVPFASLFGASMAVRMIFGGQGSPGADSFLAGAAALPFAFVALIQALLGPANFEVTSLAALFAVCLTILMLFAGLTKIFKIAERPATLGVPLMVFATAWLSKIIYAAMLR